MSPRTRPLHLIGVIALLGAVSLYGEGTAAARHHRQESADPPGEFAYYVLSLSWSPAFCLSSPADAECSGPRRYGFIVHGLWPQNENGWPEHCDVHRAVPDEVVQSMADLMPARALVYHEWSTHGTCSGLEPAEYFALVRRAFSSLAVPREMSGPTQAIEQPPGSVAAAFLHANPRLGPQSVVVTCSGQGLPRLREVRICLERDLAPRPCSTEALHEMCRAPQLIIPPIH